MISVRGASPHVMLDHGEVLAAEEAGMAESPEPEHRAAEREPGEEEKVSQIFIAHGRSKKPLDQTKRILDELKVKYRVALEEPHSGRPISEKVAEIMRECTSGIFIFTRDKKYFDEEGHEVLRPGENVVYELGAGSVLYGNKIVLFREEGVAFPTDFKEIGHISFEIDKLDAKAPELIKELVGFGVLKISAA